MMDNLLIVSTTLSEKEMGEFRNMVGYDRHAKVIQW